MRTLLRIVGVATLLVSATSCADAPIPARVGSSSKSLVGAQDDNELGGPPDMPPWAPTQGSTDRMNPVVAVDAGKGICTGTVISPYHVLTAKHCISGAYDRDPSPLGDGIVEGDARVVTIFPSYSMQSPAMWGFRFYEHPVLDLAIITLGEPFAHQTFPVATRDALPTDDTIGSWENRAVVLRGYGYGTHNEELQKACKPNHQDPWCKRRRWRNSVVSGGFNADKFKLGGSPELASGDSGGPVLYRYYNSTHRAYEYQIIGVMVERETSGEFAVAAYVDRAFVNKVVCRGGGWEFIRGHNDLVGAGSPHQLLRLGTAVTDGELYPYGYSGTQGVLCRHIWDGDLHQQNPPQDMGLTEPLILAYKGGDQQPSQRIRGWSREEGLAFGIAATPTPNYGVRIASWSAAGDSAYVLYTDDPVLSPPMYQEIIRHTWSPKSSSILERPTDEYAIVELAAPPGGPGWDVYARASNGNVWALQSSTWMRVNDTEAVEALAPAGTLRDLALIEGIGAQRGVYRTLVAPNYWELLGNTDSSIDGVTAGHDVYRLRNAGAAAAVERWDEAAQWWVTLSSAPSTTALLVARHNGFQDRVYAVDSSGKPEVHLWQCEGEACGWTTLDDNYGSTIFGHGATTP
jgi:hypothetical protein